MNKLDGTNKLYLIVSFLIGLLVVIDSQTLYTHADDFRVNPQDVVIYVDNEDDILDITVEIPGIADYMQDEGTRISVQFGDGLYLYEFEHDGEDPEDNSAYLHGGRTGNLKAFITDSHADHDAIKTIVADSLEWKYEESSKMWINANDIKYVSVYITLNEVSYLEAIYKYDNGLYTYALNGSLMDYHMAFSYDYNKEINNKINRYYELEERRNSTDVIEVSQLFEMYPSKVIEMLGFEFEREENESLFYSREDENGFRNYIETYTGINEPGAFSFVCSSGNFVIEGIGLGSTAEEVAERFQDISKEYNGSSEGDQMTYEYYKTDQYNLYFSYENNIVNSFTVSLNVVYGTGRAA